VCIGGSHQADRWIHVCRGGKVRGETMPARQTRGREGRDPGPLVLYFTESYGGEGEGLIIQEKAVEEEEVAESHKGRSGR